VIVSTINNCKGDTTFETKVIISPALVRFTVTEVFTPNGDGINELFQIIQLFKHQPVELSIYNRYGDLLYNVNDYKNDWDGSVNGEKLPQGAYYYIIKTKDNKIYKGSVSIVY